jgi:hypothetical protein
MTFERIKPNKTYTTNATTVATIEAVIYLSIAGAPFTWLKYTKWLRINVMAGERTPRTQKIILLDLTVAAAPFAPGCIFTMFTKTIAKTSSTTAIKTPVP